MLKSEGGQKGAIWPFGGRKCAFLNPVLLTNCAQTRFRTKKGSENNGMPPQNTCWTLARVFLWIWACHPHRLKCTPSARSLFDLFPLPSYLFLSFIWYIFSIVIVIWGSTAVWRWKIWEKNRHGVKELTTLRHVVQLAQKLNMLVSIAPPIMENLSLEKQKTKIEIWGVKRANSRPSHIGPQEMGPLTISTGQLFIGTCFSNCKH